jgi:hypothetical protein
MQNILQEEQQKFIEVLNIIGYENDKEKFTENFFSICLGEARNEILGRMPKEQKDILQAKVDGSEKVGELAKILGEYIDPKEMKTTIATTTARLFQEYITTIMPTLTSQRKEKLINYLDTLSKINHDLEI